MRALPRIFGLICLSSVIGACAAGTEIDNSTTTIFTTSASAGTMTTSPGDGDGDPAETSGDSNSSQGDGDGDPSGDGDGDPTTTGGNEVCGDGVRAGEEECDGNDLGGLTCLDYGFQDGTLVCTENCTLFTDTCSTCGDGQLAATESCDGNNFGGLTCTDLGYDSGVLACGPNCDSIIESGCMQAPTCGNGLLDPGEACDGNNLAGQTCQSLGYDGGSLSCTPGCLINTDACTLEQCVGLLGACNLLFDDCCEGLQCALAFCVPA